MSVTNKTEHARTPRTSAGRTAQDSEKTSLSSQFSVGPHGHLHASANAELPGRTGAGRARAKPNRKAA